LGAGHGKLSEQILRRHPGARVTVSDLDPKSMANIAAGSLGRDSPAMYVDSWNVLDSRL